MTVQEIRARLVALIAQIDGAVAAPAAQPQAAAAAGGSRTATVASWRKLTSKAGRPYARLATSDGGQFPVFAPHLVTLDLQPGNVIQLTTQIGRNDDGTTFEKVVGIVVTAADDIPF